MERLRAQQGRDVKEGFLKDVLSSLTLPRTKWDTTRPAQETSGEAKGYPLKVRRHQERPGYPCGLSGPVKDQAWRTVGLLVLGGGNRTGLAARRGLWGRWAGYTGTPEI